VKADAVLLGVLAETAQGGDFAGPQKAVGSVRAFIKFMSRTIGLWRPLG
jgi:hypothetical protein